MQKDRLVTPSFCLVLAANYLLFFGFYLLIPILPFYLTEEFGVAAGSAGAIMACYTVAALTVRPFSGYLLDLLARKPLYVFSFAAFTLCFGGYVLTSTLLMFILLRIVHGLSFGMVTVSGNTIVIDIMPSSRRGEGIGYYGLMNTLAMSLGPMTGLFLYENYSYDIIFLSAMCCAFLGTVCAVLVRTSPKEPVSHDSPVSLDRFILVKGIPLGIDLLLLSIPYGMTTTYVAMYAGKIGIEGSVGMFFTIMAAGLAFSRIFAGKKVDHGKITEVVLWGMYIAIVSFFALSACEPVARHSVFAAAVILYVTAFLLGVAFGTMFPAFNTMFINLGYNNQRGTATSTYLTFWDVGIGIGLFLGGVIGQVSSFSYAYLAGAFLSIISCVFFRLSIIPHFSRNRVR